jgi:predicted RNase H-like HicB family nuclease
MKTKTFTAIIHKEEDMYVAECPEVGTVDQGETIEEALVNLKEATRLYLEECPLPDTVTSLRFITSIEVSYP